MKENRPSAIEPLRYNYHLLNLNEGRTHSPYEAESEIMRLIAAGDEERACACLEAFMDTSGSGQDKGTFARNPLKQAEYTVVGFVTLVCRAIIAGGVDPMVAYDWSDLWSMRTSEATGTAEYLQIIRDVLHEACALVQDSQRQHDRSLHVRRAKQYVYQHLDERITVSEVADALKLSPGHLSALFRKEEGRALKRYIEQEKLKAAKHLLGTTNDPIAQIAERLTFSSASHFSDVFRRHEGTTPGTWRKRHQHVDWRDACKDTPVEHRRT